MNILHKNYDNHRFQLPALPWLFAELSYYSYSYFYLHSCFYPPAAIECPVHYRKIYAGLLDKAFVRELETKAGPWLANDLLLSVME